jgi:hypothetical protein
LRNLSCHHYIWLTRLYNFGCKFRSILYHFRLSSRIMFVIFVFSIHFLDIFHSNSFCLFDTSWILGRARGIIRKSTLISWLIGLRLLIIRLLISYDTVQITFIFLLNYSITHHHLVWNCSRFLNWTHIILGKVMSSSLILI